MAVVLLVFTLFLTVQVVYLYFLDRGFENYSKPADQAIQPVSVIVAAKNEAENLRKLIPDLLDQHYPEFEIIIIDNESTDSTPNVVWEYSSNHRIKYVESGIEPEGYNPKKWALQRGIREAKFEWVLLTDADVRIDSNHWLTEMSRGFGIKKQIVLGVSPYIKTDFSWLNLLIRFEALYTAFQYIGFALLGRPYMGVGRNLAYRKDFFNKSGGFSGIEKITGGDDDLFVNQRITKENASIIIDNRSLVYSHPKQTWRDFFNQKIRHLSVGRYYKSKDKWLLGIFLLTQFGVWLGGLVLFLSGFTPWLVILSWTVRYIFLFLAFNRLLKRLQEGFEMQYLILLDFVFPLYYISTLIGTIWAKRIQWKKKDSSQTKLSKISG